jgi:hypothetical protein
MVVQLQQLQLLVLSNFIKSRKRRCLTKFLLFDEHINEILYLFTLIIIKNLDKRPSEAYECLALIFINTNFYLIFDY